MNVQQRIEQKIQEARSKGKVPVLILISRKIQDLYRKEVVDFYMNNTGTLLSPKSLTVFGHLPIYTSELLEDEDIKVF